MLSIARSKPVTNETRKSEKKIQGLEKKNSRFIYSRDRCKPKKNWNVGDTLFKFRS
jgi:hypothetical protein